MAYTDDFALSQDVTFQSRIRMSMEKIALTVAATPPSSDAIIDQKRNTLAFNVLNSPNLYVERITLAAIEEGAGSGPLTSGSTDGNLDTAIAAVWSAVAGVTTRD